MWKKSKLREKNPEADKVTLKWDKEEKKCISKKKGMDFTMNLFLLLMLVSFILIPQFVLLHPQLQRILPTPGWQ